MEWTPSPSGDSRLPEHSLPYFQSFTLGKEVCALCGSLILSSFLNKDMCNLKHLRISLPLSKLDVSWSGFRMRRGKVLRFTRPQVESLESMLGCISPLMGERVQTLHLETRCERKRWGGLCETGLSSNDPQPRERKSTQTKGSNACSPELSDDSTDDESDTDTDADGRSDESGEDDDDGDTPESATVSGASASGINSSTSTSTTPALDGVGSGQNQGSRLSKTEQRLATLGQNQRHTMLSEHQQFNQMISATFPSLEELRVYRAGVTRLEIMKETSDLVGFACLFVLTAGSLYRGLCEPFRGLPNQVYGLFYGDLDPTSESPRTSSKYFVRRRLCRESQRGQGRFGSVERHGHEVLHHGRSSGRRQAGQYRR